MPNKNLFEEQILSLIDKGIEANKFHISNMKLSDYLISGGILSLCIFENITFSKCTIRDSFFRKVRFVNCDFIECNISQNYFMECNFFNCSFNLCNIEESSFSQSKLCEIEYTKAMFDFVTFIDTEVNISRFIECSGQNLLFMSVDNIKQILFESCEIQTLLLNKIDFSCIHFAGRCKFQNLIALNSYADGFDFSSLYLSQSQFTDSKLINSNFSNCIIENASFKGCSLSGSSFVNSTLNTSLFLECYAEKTNFSNSILKLTNLSSSTFKDCNFRNSKLDMTMLTKSDFLNSEFINCGKAAYCDFSYSNLDGVDFMGTQFKDTKFHASIIDGCKNFNPAGTIGTNNELLEAETWIN